MLLHVFLSHNYSVYIFINSAPSGSPGDLRIDINHRMPTTAKLSWTPVPEDKQNGIIIGYIIRVVGADSTFSQEIPVEKADSISAEIPNLTPFTSYNFSISAKTKAGSGPVATISSTTPKAGKITMLLRIKMIALDLHSCAK